MHMIILSTKQAALSTVKKNHSGCRPQANVLLQFLAALAAVLMRRLPPSDSMGQGPPASLGRTHRPYWEQGPVDMRLSLKPTRACRSLYKEVVG